MKENSIEAYVKILEKFSNENVIYGSTVGMTLEKYKDLQLSTEHILSDYKRVLKENEELKDKYATFVKMSSEVIANSVPVQKVKDKIIERQFELQQEYKDFEDDAIETVLNLLEKKEEWINKLETKLMYALTPTKHELAKRTQEEFKETIRENIEEDTYTIKRKLKENWNNL